MAENWCRKCGSKYDNACSNNRCSASGWSGDVSGGGCLVTMLAMAAAAAITAAGVARR